MCGLGYGGKARQNTQVGAIGFCNVNIRSEKGGGGEREGVRGLERDVEAGCRWVGEGVTAADPYRSYYNLWVGHLEDGNSFGNVGCLLLPGALDWKGQGGQDATGWGEGAGCVSLRAQLRRKPGDP
jgi:hypothetical protein